MPFARFDDLTPGAELAFELDGVEDIIVAHEPWEVRSALEAADAAARSGLWVGGYVAYEAAPGLDPGLAVNDSDGDMPLVWFGAFRERTAVDDLAPRSMRPAPYHVSGWRTRMDRASHAEGIDAIRRHIEAGDTYQVNFTFRLAAAFSGDPFELYRDLTLAQRGAFAAYLDTGRHHILSASPELFFDWRGRRIQVRPMKGTIRRGRWPAEDRTLAGQLTRSAKDRAENLMIVDLLRNDLGRIAEFGSVRVEELFALERYETVWHLTSLISARLGSGVGLADVFSALFPSGSVTGAPKQRTMEIIRDLELTPRGVYTGAVGVVAPDDTAEPRASFNVAIRTVTVDAEEGTAQYGVGGGIIWDSLSASEYEEARVKAQLLVQRRPEFSLIETLRWEPREGFLWLERHLERLSDSADYFGFDLDVDAVADALHRAITVPDRPHRVRLLLGRAGQVEVDASVSGFAVRTSPNSVGNPVDFAVDPVPVSSENVFLYHKTTVRSVYDERLKRHARASDVLLVNERGEITEFTVGNVAVCIDGRWYTPPLSSGCLPGVFRGVLLDGGVVTERVLRPHDLFGAAGIAFLNSVRGWRPAQPLEGALADWRGLSTAIDRG